MRVCLINRDKITQNTNYKTHLLNLRFLVIDTLLKKNQRRLLLFWVHLITFDNQNNFYNFY